MSKHIIYYKKFYEWCDEDLWGHIALSAKNTKSLTYLYNSFKANPLKRNLAKKKLSKMRKKNFRNLYKKKFLYEINTKDKEFKKNIRRFRSKEYFNLFKLSVFYGNIKTKSFKPFLHTTAKNQRIWAGSTPFLLESRLDILLYRTNLFKSIFFVKQFVKHQGVLVNGLCLHETNYQVRVGDIVVLPGNIYKEFYKKFYNNLKGNKILINTPNYLEINYQIGAFTIVKLPRGEEVSYPFSVNAKTHWFIK